MMVAQIDCLLNRLQELIQQTIASGDDVDDLLIDLGVARQFAAEADLRYSRSLEKLKGLEEMLPQPSRTAE